MKETAVSDPPSCEVDALPLKEKRASAGFMHLGGGYFGPIEESEPCGKRELQTPTPGLMPTLGPEPPQKVRCRVDGSVSRHIKSAEPHAHEPYAGVFFVPAFEGPGREGVGAQRLASMQPFKSGMGPARAPQSFKAPGQLGQLDSGGLGGV